MERTDDWGGEVRAPGAAFVIPMFVRHLRSSFSSVIFVCHFRPPSIPSAMLPGRAGPAHSSGAPPREVDPVALAGVVEYLAGRQVGHVDQARLREPAEHLLAGVPREVAR